MHSALLIVEYKNLTLNHIRTVVLIGLGYTDQISEIFLLHGDRKERAILEQLTERSFSFCSVEIHASLPQHGLTTLLPQ